MRVKVVMPKWGTGMNEGTIVKWLKAVGDRVEAGEMLVEIETAKSTQEMEAPATGRITEILLAVGEEAEVRTPIAIIETD
ncbi:lipoyl domain-containing protein [Novosphingobium sp. KACC 22771]|uniref:lipoyl domain-containing protein n=1 Tax=Novosphingobium sp. KACC 22771 TaxID=3025670 RepID=UPI002365D351|nr:lipoyl domain-containing protein [Novosphingobium sp. KACC 22771]WDF74264.1 lipoyl domain-containing protein [Novosphingobium sp. KACC 22771]